MKREEFCPNCEEYRETNVVEREETYTVRDRKITVPVKVQCCSSCGGSIGSDEADQEVLNTVYGEFRRQADLLTPERIKQIRKRHRLSQKSFAALLGMSEATINHYEQGGLQDQPHDVAIRACEAPEFVRDLLGRRGHLLSEWQRRRVEQALAGAPEPDGNWLDVVAHEKWVQGAGEISDRTGFRRFDPGRFASVTTWFCTRLGEVSRTVINKLVFYADFLNFRTATVSLTGTAYRKAPYGPVPADYGMLLDWMEAEGLLVCTEVEYPNGNTGFYYRAGPKARSSAIAFSSHELKVLEHVARSLGNLTAKAISDRSHQEPAWTNTLDGQLITYREAQELSLSLPE
jgi:putative zinc finger/helix-turn-helix YgiT family protein